MVTEKSKRQTAPVPPYPPLPDGFVRVLLEWYRKAKRDLPWRTEITPYRVWISEIMLQQTRVEAVKPYFARFLAELPDIPSLACVPDAKLMKLWEGLGYYSRARNLKKTAALLMEQYGGALPADLQQLQKLPGIGSYTAGAIASIAFGIPAPAVDGNVLRVLARLSGSDADVRLPQTKRAAEERLRAYCPENGAGDFTQALIELGALVCVPNAAPSCGECPLASMCVAFREGKTETLPVRSGNRPRRVEERTVLLLQDGDRFLIEKRPQKGLLAGLYELPNREGVLDETQALAFARQVGFQPLHTQKLAAHTHLFTHVEWRMTGWHMTGYFESEEGKILATRSEMKQTYAIPSAFSAYVGKRQEAFTEPKKETEP